MRISDITSVARIYGDRFTSWLDFILKWECVIGSDGQIRFENDPDDPGGLTFAGIDKASNREFPFDNPTAEAVRDTYYHSYWNFAFANTLNFPVGEVVVNFAVNVAIGEAKLFLQRGVMAG